MGPLDVQRDLDAAASVGLVRAEVGVVAAVVRGRERSARVVDEVQAGGIGQAEGLVEDRQGAGAVVAVPGGGDEGGVVALFEDADGLAGAVPLDAAEGDVVVIGTSRY